MLRGVAWRRLGVEGLREEGGKVRAAAELQECERKRIDANISFIVIQKHEFVIER